jgi:hypothetical protein
MTEGDFLLFMARFIMHTMITEHKPILLLLDNQSHLSISVLIWPFNTDMFTDDDFSPSAVTDRPVQDNKSLENFRLADSRSSNSNLEVGSKSLTSGLNKGHSSSECNLLKSGLFQKQKHVERHGPLLFLLIPQ